MESYLETHNYNLEKQLVILCSQTKLSDDTSENIKNLLRENLDWDYIKIISGRNGVFPLISWNLLNNFIEYLSIYIKEEISQHFESHTQKNLFSTLKLIEIVQVLKREGIIVLPFKGTTLAQLAYGNLALRQYVDLDVLVRPKNFDEAVQILQKEGYKPIGKSDNFKQKVLFFKRKKDVGLISSNGNVRIELHWKLSGSHFSLPVEIDELWKRLEKIDIGATELNSLPFYDLFVYLCLHGSRHKWEKFSWICDLHELILKKENSEEQFDWDIIHRHAKKYGCERVVELGLFLVNYFYELEIEYPEYVCIKNDRTFLKIAEEVDKKNFSSEVKSSGIGDWYLYHLMLKERKTDQLKLHIYYMIWYLKLTFKPNVLDKQVFNLPNFFYPLYYILRPLRLFLNYFNWTSKKTTGKN